MNPTLKQAQFSDYHGHGWMFDKVFKRDRKGNFLDANDKIVATATSTLLIMDGRVAAP